MIVEEPKIVQNSRRRATEEEEGNTEKAKEFFRQQQDPYTGLAQILDFLYLGNQRQATESIISFISHLCILLLKKFRVFERKRYLLYSQRSRRLI
jgi:hypothetical protein